jgi:hypothetical protein
MLVAVLSDDSPKQHENDSCDQQLMKLDAATLLMRVCMDNGFFSLLDLESRKLLDEVFLLFASFAGDRTGNVLF